MPFLADPFTVLTGFGPGLTHAATLRATPPAVADGPVADDAEDARAEHPIGAQHPYRSNDDAMPEHDPDGTPWAAQL